MEAPMSQLDSEGSSFKLEVNKPTVRPLLQEPPTRACSPCPKLIILQKFFMRRMPSALSMGEKSPKPPYVKGGLQEREAPMSQYELDGTAFKYDAKEPTSKPLLQVPPTRA